MVGSTSIEAKELYHIQIKNRYWKTARKFGDRVPKSVDAAYKLGLEMGIDF